MKRNLSMMVCMVLVVAMLLTGCLPQLLGGQSTKDKGQSGEQIPRTPKATSTEGLSNIDTDGMVVPATDFVPDAEWQSKKFFEHEYNDTFQNGRYVREDGNAVLYINNSFLPTYFTFLVYATDEMGERSVQYENMGYIDEKDDTIARYDRETNTFVTTFVYMNEWEIRLTSTGDTMNLVSIDGVYRHEDMVAKVDNETPAQVVTATPNRGGGGTRSPKPTAKPTPIPNKNTQHDVVTPTLKPTATPTTGTKAPPFVPEDPKKYLPPLDKVEDLWIGISKYISDCPGVEPVAEKVVATSAALKFKGKFYISTVGIADVDTFVDKSMEDLAETFSGVASTKSLTKTANALADDFYDPIGTKGSITADMIIFGDAAVMLTINIVDGDYEKTYNIDCDLDRTKVGEYTSVIGTPTFFGSFDPKLPKRVIEGSQIIKENNYFDNAYAFLIIPCQRPDGTYTLAGRIAYCDAFSRFGAYDFYMVEQ